MVLRGERKGVEKKFYELSCRVAEESGLKIYDMDYLSGTGELRLYIYSEETGTAQIDDCVKVDQAMTPYLEEDWVPSKLTLEVSSPGVDRQLTAKEHFQSAVGENISLQLTKKFADLVSSELREALPKKIKGEKKVTLPLAEVSAEGIRVKLDEKQWVEVNFIDIKKANLETEIAFN